MAGPDFPNSPITGQRYDWVGRSWVFDGTKWSIDSAGDPAYNLPTGVLLLWGGSKTGAAVPSGFLLCDGSAVSRTTYAALYAVIGTTYGAGNGTTTFNLPYGVGAVPYGIAVTSNSRTTSITTGTESANHTHTISLSISSPTGNEALPFHSHTVGSTTTDSGGAVHAHTTTDYYNNNSTSHTGTTAGENSTHTHTITFGSGDSSATAAHTHNISVTANAGTQSAGHTHTYGSVEGALVIKY